MTDIYNDTQSSHFPRALAYSVTHTQSRDFHLISTTLYFFFLAQGYLWTVLCVLVTGRDRMLLLMCSVSCFSFILNTDSSFLFHLPTFKHSSCGPQSPMRPTDYGNSWISEGRTAVPPIEGLKLLHLNLGFGSLRGANRCHSQQRATYQ